MEAEVDVIDFSALSNDDSELDAIIVESPSVESETVITDEIKDVTEVESKLIAENEEEPVIK